MKYKTYVIIIRPKIITKDNLTKIDLSNYLTTKDLSDEFKEESKVLSVNLKKLVDLGLVVRRKV